MIRKYFYVLMFLCLGTIVTNGAEAIKEITFTPQSGKDFTPEVYEYLKFNKGKPLKLVFKEGIYDFFPEKAFEKYLKISNNDNGIRKIAFYLNGHKNVEIDGGGATFMFHGGIIPFVLEDGEDYKLHNFKINWDKPFTFEGKVIENSKSDMTFDIQVSPNNDYEIIAEKLYFKGYDWKLGLGENIVFDAATKRPHYYTSKYEYQWSKFPLKAKELSPGVIRFSNLKAKDVPVVAFSVGEEELRGVDTKPLVGHLAAWNYFMSIKNPANTEFTAKWAAYAKAKNIAGHKDKPLTNDPMEATYIGINMWKQAVEKAKSTDVDKVIAAMSGQTFKAPSGITSKMDEKNHHLHKSVFIGEVKADGQFNVVWKTPGPVKAKPWSPYIVGNDKKKDEPEKK